MHMGDTRSTFTGAPVAGIASGEGKRRDATRGAGPPWREAKSPTRHPAAITTPPRPPHRPLQIGPHGYLKEPSPGHREAWVRPFLPRLMTTSIKAEHDNIYNGCVRQMKNTLGKS